MEVGEHAAQPRICLDGDGERQQVELASGEAELVANARDKGCAFEAEVRLADRLGERACLGIARAERQLRAWIRRREDPRDLVWRDRGTQSRRCARPLVIEPADGAARAQPDPFYEARLAGDRVERHTLDHGMSTVGLMLTVDSYVSFAS